MMIPICTVATVSIIAIFLHLYMIYFLRITAAAVIVTAATVISYGRGGNSYRHRKSRDFSINSRLLFFEMIMMKTIDEVIS
jgi:hypothetical protein